MKEKVLIILRYIVYIPAAICVFFLSTYLLDIVFMFLLKYMVVTYGPDGMQNGWVYTIIMYTVSFHFAQNVAYEILPKKIIGTYILATLFIVFSIFFAWYFFDIKVYPISLGYFISIFTIIFTTKSLIDKTPKNTD